MKTLFERVNDLSDFWWYLTTGVISFVVAMSVIWIPLGTLIILGVL